MEIMIMETFTDWRVLVAAFILDLLLGDPEKLPHPVRLMGLAIEKLEPVFRKFPLKMELSGGLFALALVIGTWCATFFIIKIADLFDPWCASALQVLFIWFSISVRSLEKSAMKVFHSLNSGRLGEARQRVSMIVGRDVDSLDERGVSKAAVETVAENFVDGILSPLFFAAVGGAPLALAFKMASTLDSMVGYKNEKYIKFGKVSARLDDVLNFIPARLCIPFILLAAQILAKRGGDCLNTAVGEGRNHSSPNAGYPEAAFAGALGIKLGGPSLYQGVLSDKPHIGADLGETRPRHIKKACDLMQLSSFIALVFVVLSIVLGSLLM